MNKIIIERCTDEDEFFISFLSVTFLFRSFSYLKKSVYRKFSNFSKVLKDLSNRFNLRTNI